MREYTDIIERLEKAEGASRELDAAIFSAATGAKTWWYDFNCHIDAQIRNGVWKKAKEAHPDYDPDPEVKWRYAIDTEDGDLRKSVYGEIPLLSASIDAAVALVGKMLPGWGYRWMLSSPGWIDGIHDKARPDVAVIHHPVSSGGGPKWAETGATPALALVLALFRALRDAQHEEREP